MHISATLSDIYLYIFFFFLHPFLSVERLQPFTTYSANSPIIRQEKREVPFVPRLNIPTQILILTSSSSIPLILLFLSILLIFPPNLESLFLPIFLNTPRPPPSFLPYRLLILPSPSFILTLASTGGQKDEQRGTGSGLVSSSHINPLTWRSLLPLFSNAAYSHPATTLVLQESVWPTVSHQHN